MNNYTWSYIQSHPQETKRLSGIDYDQLQDLIDYLKLFEEREKQKGEKKKIRINKAGGGREDKISQEEQEIERSIDYKERKKAKIIEENSGIMR